jgi:hypothetical protein
MQNSIMAKIEKIPLYLMLVIIPALLFAGCCSIATTKPVSELTGNCANVNMQSLHISMAPDGNVTLTGVEQLDLPGFNKTSNFSSANFECHSGYAPDNSSGSLVYSNENASIVYCRSKLGGVDFTRTGRIWGSEPVHIDETNVEISEFEFAKQGDSYVIYNIVCSDLSTQ